MRRQHRGCGRRLPAVAIAAGLALGVCTRDARAALDPDKAEADTHALLDSSDYSFCSKPAHPLSDRARALCPLAGEIPGCTALVEECATPKELPLERGPFWEKLGNLLTSIAPYVAWTSIVALIGVLLFLVVRAIRAARDEALPDVRVSTSDVTLLPGATLAEARTAALALFQRAGDARARGDAREAVFLYLAAALRALDDQGALRLARDRTNGEYVRECEDAAARPALRDIVRVVDGVQFGGDEATPEAVARAELGAERILRPARPGAHGLVSLTTLALVLLLGATACGKLGGGSNANPAGQGLLTDLLAKQGAEISSLPGSLANLPMQGTKGPVVILDAERVPLEEATRTHLVAWVNQGGTLVLAGAPSLWPSELWAKSIGSYDPGPGKVEIVTRDAPPEVAHDDEDDDDAAKAPPPQVTAAATHVHRATLARRVAMTWPSEDRAPRAIARLDDGELYGAVRAFGKGKVLGLASADLLTNVGLAVPGNAAATIGLLAALDRHEFAVARTEQGISPPDNPFAGLLHIGLGPALLHVAFFIPLLFVAFGVRQSAPRAEPPAPRRAFAEHVQAVGGMYARRKAARHALAVYAKFVDERVRAAATRGSDPVHFLATRSGTDPTITADLVARGALAEGDGPPRGDELEVLARLSALYAKAMEPG